MTEALSGGQNRFPTRLLLLSLLAMLGVFPPETRGESLAGCALLVALLVLICWQKPVPSGARLWLVLLLASAWPLLLTAAAPGSGLEPLVLFFLAGAAGVHAAVRGTRWSREAPWVLAAAGAVVAMHGISQVLWGLEADAAWVEVASGVPDRELVLARLREGRAFAAFATPAALGAYLALVLPVTLGLAAGRRGRLRLLLLALAGIQVVGILCSASGTAVAALLGAGLLALGMRRFRWRTLGASAVLALLLVAGVIGMRGTRVLDLTRLDSPFRLRAGNFRVAGEVIQEHPWVGVGPGGFGEVFPRYRREGDNEARHVHNLPLEMAAEIGIVPGTVVSLLFFTLFLGPLIRSRQPETPWRQGLGVGLAAFALHNLVDFTAYFPSILWTAALGRALLHEHAPSRERETAPAHRLLGGIVLAGSLVAAALGVLSGLSWNARYAGRHAAASGEIPLALSLSRRSVRLAPWDVDARLFLTQAILDSELPGIQGREETLRRALSHADRAVALSPVRSSGRAVRSRVRAGLGDTPGAYTDMYQAARHYPIKTEYARLRDDLEGRLPDRRLPEGRGP